MRNGVPDFESFRLGIGVKEAPRNSELIVHELWPRRHVRCGSKTVSPVKNKDGPPIWRMERTDVVLECGSKLTH